MATSKNIEQSEVPAKVWQIDGLSKSQDGLKQLIIAQTSTYPTKTERHITININSAKAPRCED